MVSVRKRRHADVEEVPEPAAPAPPQHPEPPSMLARLRDLWQFSCLCQWLYIFGGVVKLDNIDIDELEAQCLSPHSTTLQEIGLALLKYLSSHRGLTLELFDEYTRRQYISKAPQLHNPFGTDEVPAKFSEFTVFQKIRILHQMTLFIMMNPDKLRDKMSEQKDADRDQTTWRIEPFGWDKDDRVYYVLDDNRVYRSTEVEASPPRPKKNTKKARAQARRSSKRRRVSAASVDNTFGDAEDEDSVLPGDENPYGPDAAVGEDVNDGPGGMKWECIAVSLEELHALLTTISGRKDPNERILHDKIVEHLLPILEQQDERRKRRDKEREKELLNLAKMATAKRSSRIAGRQEQQRHEDLVREEEQKRLHHLDASRKEEQVQRKFEKERERRLVSREKRLREREVRRAQHEEELAQLSEDSKNHGSGVGRMSERRRLAEIQKNTDALRELEEEGEEEWIFDCICGLHGKVDDGQHSISCERCNIWQHSKCLGVDEGEAEKDDFHFICNTCKHRAENAANRHAMARPIIKIKTNKAKEEGSATNGLTSPEQSIAGVPRVTPASLDVPVTSVPAPAPAPALAAIVSPIKPGIDKDTENGHHKASIARLISTESPKIVVALPSILGPPESKLDGAQVVPVKIDNSVALPLKPKPAKWEKPMSVLGSELGPQKLLIRNGHGHAHPFSVPHPGLSQPDLSPRKSHAYGTIHEHQLPGPPSLSEASANAHQRSPAQTPAPAVTLTPGSSQLPRMQPSPTSFTTPRLHYGSKSQAGSFSTDIPSSPLPPSQGGLSPTKHSPTVVKEAASGLSIMSPTSLVLPPTAALSPSAPQQILTPPVKPEGAAHRQSFSGAVPDGASSSNGEA
ncbi:phd finger domain protein [Ophiostoma piceae UAMH 11346]|uniref:Phd finger domain protein n=1 Tax=Ophiostoma piceae (strain UAMH 11346) TaxID=1262450 RepID=S3CED6_OPHP1|nr:phd finger domain protein [Ophiostoma piceae UAMH 11346]